VITKKLTCEIFEIRDTLSSLKSIQKERNCDYNINKILVQRMREQLIESTAQQNSIQILKSCKLIVE